MEQKTANLGKKIKKKEEKNQAASEQTVQSTAPEKKKSKWWAWLLGCCGGLLVLTIILLVVGYFTVGKKIIKEAKNISEQESEFDIEKLREEVYKNSDNHYNDSEKDNNMVDEPILSPSETVASYLNSILGTLPNSELDDVEAKSHLSDKLRLQYDDPYFIQQTLCIQDGPTDIKIGKKDMYGDEAYITVKAEYGDEYIDIWDFALEKKEGEWLIYAIYCLKN